MFHKRPLEKNVSFKLAIFLEKQILFKKVVPSRTMDRMRFAGRMLRRHGEVHIRYTAFREADTVLCTCSVLFWSKHRTFRAADTLLGTWNVWCSSRHRTFREADTLLGTWNVWCSSRHRTFREAALYLKFYIFVSYFSYTALRETFWYPTL